ACASVGGPMTKPKIKIGVRDNRLGRILGEQVIELLKPHLSLATFVITPVHDATGRAHADPPGAAPPLPGRPLDPGFLGQPRGADEEARAGRGGRAGRLRVGGGAHGLPGPRHGGVHHRGRGPRARPGRAGHPGGARLEGSPQGGEAPRRSRRARGDRGRARLPARDHRRSLRSRRRAREAGRAEPLPRGRHRRPRGPQGLPRPGRGEVRGRGADRGASRAAAPARRRPRPPGLGRRELPLARMLDSKRIRTETDRVREAIAFKKSRADLDRYLALDEERRGLLVETEGLKHERNATSEEIGRLKKAGQDAADKVQAMKQVGDRIKSLDLRIAELDHSLKEILDWIPNVPHPSVPKSEDATGNVIVREAGEIRKLSFTPKSHWELAESLGLLDFERAGKIAGAGFLLFTGRGARLERALIHFMIDLAAKRGYTEVWAPHLVRRECLFGTGQLPKLEEDMYRIEGEELFLNPTAEVPITNIYRDEILDGGALPIRHVGYCASYRKEA